MRQLGKALLKDVANRMSGRQGQRDLRHAGAAGELSGASREWTFGDTEPWNVTRTITNAVVRTVGEGGDPTQGVRLDVRDIEVNETEARTQAAVALLVDTSFSMAMANRWVPMKRTALALHQLITSRFRGDHLQLIGFGRAAARDGHRAAHRARRDVGQGHQPAPRAAARQPPLPQAPERPAGAADRHRRRADQPPRARRRGVLLLPAAPAHRRVVVRELDNAARLGAQTTFFRLGDDPGLARFIDQMADRVDGRVVAPGARRPRCRRRRQLPRRSRRLGTAPATWATGTAAAGSGSAADLVASGPSKCVRRLA